jgi:peptide/nickel transport system substrate-binding protein
LVAGASLVVAACGDDDDDADQPDSTEVLTEGTVAEGTVAEGTVAEGTVAEGTTPATDAEGTAPATTTGDTAEPGAAGGTLVWAHEQEPPDMHLDDPENNLSITSWIRQAMFEGLYGITVDTTFFPELLAEPAEITENADGTVTGVFTLRDGLTWSDGDDLTADDVKYTYDMFMVQDDAGEYIYLLGDRTGYDTITDFTVDSPTQFTITWSAFFSGFPTLFTEVHPSHVFPADPAAAAAAENEALRTWTVDGAPLPSSGPLVFASWAKGTSMDLVRNEVYHGSNSPDVTNTGPAYVDGVTINFVPDTDSQINALKANEAQMIFTQPQTQFEELATDDQFSVASSAGPVYEHWGFNLNNKHLSKVEVREAVALAMDKVEVMTGLYTPLFGDLLPANGLGNTYWMSNQPDYIDHSGEAGYGAGDAEAARARLESAGYVDSGGVYEHPEDGRLTLRVGTTGGNALRELQQQLLQAGLAEAGIELVIDNDEGSTYFTEQPFNPDAVACALSGGAEGNCEIWDITQFAWVGGPWPGSNSAAYRSDSENNPYGYQNPEFDAKADECDATVDDAARATCYNEADEYLTTLNVDPNGLVVVPITQKPSFYAYSSDALSQAAVAPDADDAGPLVNVVDFQFAG